MPLTITRSPPRIQNFVAAPRFMARARLGWGLRLGYVILSIDALLPLANTRYDLSLTGNGMKTTPTPAECTSDRTTDRTNKVALACPANSSNPLPTNVLIKGVHLPWAGGRAQEAGDWHAAQRAQ